MLARIEALDPGLKSYTTVTAELALRQARAAEAEVAADFNIIGKFTSPFNASGVSTVTLPRGHTDDGRPVAFQLAGAHGSEATLLRVAHAYQQATDWHTRRPPGC